MNSGDSCSNGVSVMDKKAGSADDMSSMRRVLYPLQLTINSYLPDGNV